jgi:secondary thiamine-phosphate synthase enzyme
MRKVLQFAPTDKIFTNITEKIKILATEWGKSGIVHIFSKHTTCCVYLLEDELLHKADIRFFLDKMVPRWKEPDGDRKNIKYLHDLISLRDDVPPEERINGHSHIRSLFFNSSETVPLSEGKLLLGDWKDIFIIELDPGREREIICTFIES